MNTPVPDLQLDVRDGLATLTFDRPNSKVNLLASPVMLRLDELLASVEAAVASGTAHALLVRSGKPNTFIAGADIDELAAMETAATATEMARRGDEIFLRLERLPIPTLAAISGACVGGGLELVLSSDYRVASDHASTKLGLPETRLGIMPGLGGTVRLPRLVGLQVSLDMILSARLVNAERAFRVGLIDRVIPAADFEAEAASLAAELARGGSPLRRKRRSLLRRLIDGPVGRPLVSRMTRKAVLKRTRGHYPAIPAALDATVGGLGMSVEQALEEEAATFGRLAVTPECKNLFFVYRITEAARKVAPPGEPLEVKQAAVVGAGVMGAGIAELFAYQTIPVRVVDIDEERVAAGVATARELLEKAGKKSDWTDSDLKARTDCLAGGVGLDGLDNVDVVVEAVLERMDIKRAVFADLEDRVTPTALLATNTSALSITTLQESMDQPDRVCGLHFFNPPYRMPLVEIVRGARTSDDAMATAFHVATRLGKTPVSVTDAPGFVVNRTLAAYLTEAGFLLQEGMPVKRLDRVMTQFGMPVGPLRLLDEIGLDVVAEVSRTMQEGFGDRFAAAPIMADVLATGLTGRKAGEGFYVYKKGKATGVSPAIDEISRNVAGDEPPPESEAEERMVFAMINEAARILDDGVIDSSEALDVAMIMGTGFPPFRGGLLRYADSLGLTTVTERLRAYAKTGGKRLEPAPALLARQTFYSA
jgi:3-hydroxyacyl-CoA dehydrogenase/enoyl-CoA hydratase/3-hydroxybutyryl-CoA epimerase